METRKLLIADGTEEFQIALEEALKDRYSIRTCQDGATALELLRTFQPDLMLLDLMLPELDGVSLLCAAVEEDLCPMVLATSRLINEYVVDACEKLGVGYVIRKPCNLRATVERLEDLSQRIHRPVPRFDAGAWVRERLLEFSLGPNMQGFSCVLEGILAMAENPDQSLTKELYPALAGSKDSWKNVERNGRRALDKAWKQGDRALWLRTFPVGAHGPGTRPALGVFICQMADELRKAKESADFCTK